ncbi:MAG: glutamate--tRNA ligase [Chitinophagales bacterium]
MTKKVRSRFAPSPTGPLHIGGVRTALYAYLYAKKMGGDFILRIEDTDQGRYVEGAEEYIIETLEWCGLTVDEGPKTGGKYGPYRQSERKEMYRQYAIQLVESGHAYYAFDTPEELNESRAKAEANGASFKYNFETRQDLSNSLNLTEEATQAKINAGEPYVIRLKVPRDEEVKFKDAIRDWVTFKSDQLDDKVLFKADGMPTYHLANVVDDHLMEITHVIRGEEWLPSTPTHVYLYRFLGWEETMPEFAHLPLILKPEGKGKLSKRDGDRLGFPVFPLDWTDPETNELSHGFRERGFLPDAFVNMLAFLGWNPGTEQELFSREELINAFTLERINKSGAKFDFEKAKWFNQQYLKDTSNELLLNDVKAHLADKGIEKSDAFLLAFIELFKERATFTNDLIEQGYYLFEAPKEYNAKVVKKKWNDERKPVFVEIHDQLNQLQEWSAVQIEMLLKGTMEKHSLGFGDIFQPFRVMISGEAGGPSIFELTELMGKELVVARMEKAFEIFDGMNKA